MSGEEQGSEFWSESGVFRLVRDLRSNALPAVAEAVAAAVHLQDVDMVGEAVQQQFRLRSRPLRCRPPQSVQSLPFEGVGEIKSSNPMPVVSAPDERFHGSIPVSASWL